MVRNAGHLNAANIAVQHLPRIWGKEWKLVVFVLTSPFSSDKDATKSIDKAVRLRTTPEKSGYQTMRPEVEFWFPPTALIRT